MYNNKNGKFRLQGTVLEETGLIFSYGVGLCAFEQHAAIHVMPKRALWNSTAAAKQQISVGLRKKTSSISTQGEIILRHCKDNCIQLQCKNPTLVLNIFPAGFLDTSNIFHLQ